MSSTDDDWQENSNYLLVIDVINISFISDSFYYYSFYSVPRASADIFVEKCSSINIMDIPKENTNKRINYTCNELVSWIHTYP